ncbi:MAG: hypothetical protein PHF84_09770, partial [bacterium]|nr:hypothetical protein [bacterium]
MRINKIILLFLLLLIMPSRAWSQTAGWEKTITIKDKNGIQPDIAGKKNNLYVVYSAGLRDQYGICLVQSSNRGQDWSKERTVAAALLKPDNLTVICVNDKQYIFWIDFRDGNNEIYFTCSREGDPVGFEKAINITRNKSDSINFTVRASGEMIYLVWSDNRTGDYELYCKVYNVNEKQWGDETAVTKFSGGSLDSGLLALMGELHLVWQQKDGQDWRIMYSQSQDGKDWTSPVPVSGGLEKASDPVILSTADGLLAVFRAENNSQADIYSALYDVIQDKWTSAVPVFMDLRIEKDPVCVSASSGLYLFGLSLFESSDQVFCSESRDRGLTWSSKADLTQAKEGIKNFKVNYSTLDDNIYLVWEQGDNGKICLKSMDRSCPAPVIANASHKQDEWSSRQDFRISWTVPDDTSGIRDFSYVLDQNPETIPDLFLAEYPVREASFYNVGDGIWYFHLKARDKADNISATIHYKVMINSRLYASSEKYYIIKYGDTLWD